jgi:insulysin
MDRRAKVAEMTVEEFNVQKNSVRTQVAEKDKNMGEESGRFWGEISGHSYDFDKQEKHLKILDEITLD